MVVRKSKKLKNEWIHSNIIKYIYRNVVFARSNHVKENLLKPFEITSADT